MRACVLVCLRGQCDRYWLSFQMQTKVPDALQGDKVDAILCVAGGWGGGNAASPGGSHATLPPLSRHFVPHQGSCVLWPLTCKPVNMFVCVGLCVLVYYVMS